MADVGQLLRCEQGDGDERRSWLMWQPPAEALRWSGHAMLALWRSVDARACHVAIAARRVGLLTDDALLLFVTAIALYDQAQNVMRECIDRANAGLRDPKVRPAPRVVATPPALTPVLGSGVVLVGDMSPQIETALAGAGVVVLR